MSTSILALGIETAGYISGMKAATKITAGMQSAVTKLGADLTKLGAGLTAAVTLPVTLMAKRSMASFIAFDKAIVNSQSIMQNVTADIDARMRNVATTISQQLPIAADKAAESFYFLASAGLDTEQSIAALPTVAKLATAGMFSLETATELLCDAQLALGETSADAETHVKNLTRLADQLARGGDISSTSILQLSKSLTNEAAAAMRNFKVATVDGIAVLSAYASQGIKGEEAGSMLARSIRLVTNAAVEHEAAWKKFGISAFDEKGNLQYVKVVNQLEKALGGLSTKQRSVALSELGFQALIQGAILPLMGASNQISKFRDELDNAGGTLDRTTNNQLKSFWSQLAILGNTVQNFGRELAASLSMPMRALASIMQGIVTAFTWIPGPMKTVIAIMGLLAAATGPLVTALGVSILSFRAITTLGYGYARSLIYGFGQLRQYVAAVWSSIAAQRAYSTTTITSRVLQDATSASTISSSTALVLNTVARNTNSLAIAGGSGALVSYSGALTTSTMLQGVATVSAGALTGALTLTTAAATSLWVALAPVLPIILGVAAAVGAAYVVFKGLQRYTAQISESFAVLKSILVDAISNALRPFGVTTEWLGRVTSSVWNAILEIVGMAAAALVTTVIAIVVTIIEQWNILWATTTTIMAVIGDSVVVLWNNMGAALSAVMTTIIETVKIGWNTLKLSINTSVKAIVDSLSWVISKMEALAGMIPGLGEKVAGMLSSARGGLDSLSGSLADDIASNKNSIGASAGAVGGAWGKAFEGSDASGIWQRGMAGVDKSYGNIGKAWGAVGKVFTGYGDKAASGFESPGDTAAGGIGGGKPGGLEERKYADLALEGSVEAYKSEIRRGGQASKKQETLLATIAKYTKQTASLAKDDSKNSIRLRTV